MEVGPEDFLARCAMGVVMERRRFSVDEYRKMADAGILSAQDRVELTEGELVLMAPIGHAHASFVGRLVFAFQAAVRSGFVLWVRNPISLPPSSVPQPDVALLKLRANTYGSALPGASDVLLVIEVADTTQTYDRDVKIPLYGRHGIPEAWLFDTQRRRLEIHREAGQEGYRLLLRPDANEVVSPLAFPEVRIDLATVFADLG